MLKFHKITIRPHTDDVGDDCVDVINVNRPTIDISYDLKVPGLYSDSHRVTTPYKLSHYYCYYLCLMCLMLRLCKKKPIRLKVCFLPVITIFNKHTHTHTHTHASNTTRTIIDKCFLSKSTDNKLRRISQTYGYHLVKRVMSALYKIHRIFTSVNGIIMLRMAPASLVVGRIKTLGTLEGARGQRSPLKNKIQV